MFKAVKPCRFAGKDYRIEDPIPDGVVLPTAVNGLIKAGVIAEVGTAGPLLPASTSIEKEQEPSAIPETEKELMNLTRKELVEIATNLGMKVDDSHTKRMLTNYILEVKQGSDE